MPVILIRRATNAEWADSTRVLQEGELALNTTNNKLKVGNGQNIFAELPYINLLPSELALNVQQEITNFIQEGTGINTSVVNNELVIDVDTSIIADKVYVDDAINNLGNSLPDTYVTIGMISNPDGVASIGPDGYIPDGEIPPTITRDTELSSHNSATTNVHGITNTANLLTKSGGILTGFLTLHADPVNSLDAATKQYVDAVSEGLHIHASVVAATTTNINLSTAVQNGSVLDGVTLVTGNRILIKNQTNKTENGIYVVSATGAPTRALDFDTPAEIDGGDFVFVLGGTINDNTGWVQVNTVGAVGSNDIEFTQFTGTGTYTAGAGLSLTGTQFSVDNTIARTNNPTFTGTVSGITKSMVGLSNVDNTSDVNKPVSTAVQAELDKKTDELYLYVPVSNATTASSANHKYKMIHFTNSGQVTLTLPNQTTDPGWEEGSSFEIRQMGDGQILVQAESPAQLYSAENQFRTRVKYSSLFIEKIGPNLWIMTGDTIV